MQMLISVTVSMQGDVTAAVLLSVLCLPVCVFLCACVSVCVSDVCVCVCWRAPLSKVEGRIRRRQGGISFCSHLVQLGGTSSGFCSGGRLRPNPESERFLSCVTNWDSRVFG